MKIGDLVRHKGADLAWTRPGIILDLIQKKCWRTDIKGKVIDWNKIEPEAHAVVLMKGNKLTIPLTDLEKINERR